MNSSITVKDRAYVTLTGVKSVESITDSKIFLFTEAGDLVIKGETLESDEFDPADGIYRIRGHIISLCYTTEKYHFPDNIISRLFR